MVSFQRMRDELDSIEYKLPVIGKAGCLTLVLVSLFILFIIGFAIGYGVSRPGMSITRLIFTIFLLRYHFITKTLWYFTILTLFRLSLRRRRKFVVIRGAKKSKLHFCIKQFSKLFCSCGRETFDNNETWPKFWGSCSQFGLSWRLQRVSKSSKMSSKICL